MQRDVESPDAYLEDLEPAQRKLVEAVRSAIADVAPDVEEGLRYGMLDYPGLANLGAQKRYVALYVAPDVLASHREHFPGVDAGKSCLRFKRADQAEPEALRALLRDVLAYRREHDED